MATATLAADTAMLRSAADRLISRCVAQNDMLLCCVRLLLGWVVRPVARGYITTAAGAASVGGSGKTWRYRGIPWFVPEIRVRRRRAGKLGWLGCRLAERECMVRRLVLVWWITGQS